MVSGGAQASFLKTDSQLPGHFYAVSARTKPESGWGCCLTSLIAV